MITSSIFDPTKVEPWRISASGKVTRVPRHRANLNPRQERFVVEYLKDGNGTKAAIRAGYATSSAAVHACRLLKNETVLEKLRASQDQVLRRTGLMVERTWRQLEAIAYFDLSSVFDRKGNLLTLDKMPKNARRVIDSIKIQESVKGGRRFRTLQMVKFADKLAALEALGKYLGIFPKPLKAGR